MSKYWKVVGVSTLVVVLAGCGHHGPPVDGNAASQGQAFITQLKSVPADQRLDYIKDHPEGVRSIVASRDRALMDQFQGVIRSGH